MNILSGIKSLFAKDEPCDALVESRRRFLKGAAGLAAVAVVASAGGVRLLSSTEIDRLKAMVESGRVIGQTFYLDRPAVLVGLRNVEFVDCQFVATADFTGRSMVEFSRCSNVAMRRCRFETPKLFHGCAISA